MRDRLSEIDRHIINLIQSRFPLVPDPYKRIAQELGIKEHEAFKRVNRLRELKLIRRIGAVFDSGRLGFHSTLVGVRVEERFLGEVAEKINNLFGVTHHYQRDDSFNLWFTLTVKDANKIDEYIIDIQKWPGVLEIMNLPAKHTFKIKVDFQV